MLLVRRYYIFEVQLGAVANPISVTNNNIISLLTEEKPNCVAVSYDTELDV